ncbi:MAG TPA: hypothetical protein IGQ15_04245 [Thermosynechococcus sp. M98_K2018_005]|uniref:hypothetical protein n=1 Tax=Thermosynechococcus sp. M98_K2018_005 TaxID=2747811 RepID=UPI001A003426|nr:hypothetical protein [Thermosynechococcus sp. M98_K2018_005]HIK34898.1 hypothetical protein [Thermosynechococcus sp. M98_K2018_005]
METSELPVSQQLRRVFQAASENYAALLKTLVSLVSDQEQLHRHQPMVVQRWTRGCMQKAFPSFRAAKAYFRDRYGITARGFDELVARVNAAEDVLVHLGYAVRANAQIAAESTALAPRAESARQLP